MITSPGSDNDDLRNAALGFSDHPRTDENCVGEKRRTEYSKASRVTERSGHKSKFY